MWFANATVTLDDDSKDNGVTSHQGEIVAAFDGLHGWFWRNVGTTEVTVTLETSGDYKDIRILE